MTHVLDEVWFDRYHAIKIGIGEAYEKLEPRPETLEKLRVEFEASDYQKNIALFCDRVDVTQYQQHLGGLEQLQQDIETNETNPQVRELYLDAINDLETTAKMIIAGASGDQKTYIAENIKMYSLPDEHVFDALCHWIRHDAELALENDNQKLIELAQKVLDIIPSRSDNHRMLIPTEKVFHSVRQAHHQKNGYYDQLFGNEGWPEQSYVTQLEGDDICKQILAAINAGYSIADSENNVWAVMRSRKELVRPVGYRLDRDEFVGIVSHEIGSHILEEVNGLKQPLKLLSTGLAGFEKGNEGRAYLREQIVYDSEQTFLNQFSWEYIILLHLSVSLAAGLYKKPYTFSELYETLYILYSFWREKRMPYATNNDTFAHEEAWSLTIRTMKGTDGSGGCYLKDSVYLEGNIRCWQLAMENPGIILFGDLGIFDVTNARQREIVRSLNQ